MKKILLTIISLIVLLWIWFGAGKPQISDYCKITSCTKYQKAESSLQEFFQKAENRFFPNDKSFFQDTLVKIQTLREDYKSSYYNFVFDYLEYWLKQTLNKFLAFSESSSWETNQEDNEQTTQNEDTNEQDETINENNDSQEESNDEDNQEWDNLKDLVNLQSFSFKPAYDDAYIQEITFINIWDWVSATNQADLSIDKLFLFDQNWELLWETKLVNWYAYFSFKDYPFLEKKQEVKLYVKYRPAQINNINNTNKIINLIILGSWQTAWWYQTKIISKSNWEIVTWVDTTKDISSNDFNNYVRKSYPTLSKLDQVNDFLNTSNNIYWFNVNWWDNWITLKEIRLDISIYDYKSSWTWLKLLSDSFELYIWNSRLSQNNVDFYNKEWRCSDLIWTQINSTQDMDAQDWAKNYCLKIIFKWNYNNGYTISSEKDFKLYAEMENVSSNDAITTRLNDVSDNKGMFDYAWVNSLANSLIWSDNAWITLDLNTENWFSDALLPSLPLESWNLKR